MFAIGRNRLVEELKPNLPLAELHGREQGYLVVPVEAGTCQVVFLAAESALGAYYAAATAAQLVDGATGVYHSAAVVDYPDFLVRSYRLATWSSLAELDRDLQGLERMSRHKLNLAYAGYSGHNPDWYRPDRLYRAGVAEAGEWCRRTGVMALGAMVNPYSHLGFMPDEAALSAEARATWTHADEASWEKLQSAFRIGLDAGARTVMLLADDFVPHEGRNRWNYSLYAPEDRRRFVNLQNAQAAVLNRLRGWLDRDYPGTRLEFCPPWYANEFIDRSEGKAEIYFRELAAQIPPGVGIVWTGPHGEIAFGRHGRPAPLPGPRRPPARLLGQHPLCAQHRVARLRRLHDPLPGQGCTCAASSSRSTPNGRRPSTNSPTDGAST